MREMIVLSPEDVCFVKNTSQETGLCWEQFILSWVYWMLSCSRCICIFTNLCWFSPRQFCAPFRQCVNAQNAACRLMVFLLVCRFPITFVDQVGIIETFLKEFLNQKQKKKKGNFCTIYFKFENINICRIALSC